MTKTEKKYKVNSKDSNYLLSFNKMIGLTPVDIQGYVSNEFGEPTFLISKIIMSDGSSIGVEGEHDHPYLTDYNEKVESIMEKISEEIEDES